jgi:hypothetical protein
MNCVKDALQLLIPEICEPARPKNRTSYLFVEFFPQLLQAGYAPVLTPFDCRTEEMDQSLRSGVFIWNEIYNGVMAVLGVQTRSGTYHAVAASRVAGGNIVIEDRYLRYRQSDFIYVDALLLYPIEKRVGCIFGEWE